MCASFHSARAMACWPCHALHIRNQDSCKHLLRFLPGVRVNVCFASRTAYMTFTTPTERGLLH